MNPPLIEVNLSLLFDPLTLSEDRLQYFYRMNNDLLPDVKTVEHPAIASYISLDRNDSVLIGSEQIQIRSMKGVSFPRLRSNWTRVIDSFVDTFNIQSIRQISLSYLNEIAIQDLQNFRNYMNISFQMPSSLKERIGFFRSEFTYKYDFGEIHVWLQPDWDDQLENYCIQLSLESRHLKPVQREELFPRMQQLHEGIKDVFHQILSQNFIRQLPN
jgi:uncharacterized protein (TIGR04255 family)